MFLVISENQTNSSSNFQKVYVGPKNLSNEWIITNTGLKSPWDESRMYTLRNAISGQYLCFNPIFLPANSIDYALTAPISQVLSDYKNLWSLTKDKISSNFLIKNVQTNKFLLAMNQLEIGMYQVQLGTHQNISTLFQWKLSETMVYFSILFYLFNSFSFKIFNLINYC